MSDASVFESILEDGFGERRTARCICESGNMPWFKYGEQYEYAVGTIAGRGNPRAKGIKIYKVWIKIPDGAEFPVDVPGRGIFNVPPPPVKEDGFATPGMNEGWFNTLFEPVEDKAETKKPVEGKWTPKYPPNADLTKFADFPTDRLMGVPSPGSPLKKPLDTVKDVAEAIEEKDPEILFLETETARLQKENEDYYKDEDIEVCPVHNLPAAACACNNSDDPLEEVDPWCVVHGKLRVDCGCSDYEVKE